MENRPTPDEVAAWPALFIVGAPRCGTTSMSHALGKHPDIAFSRPKEPHFFMALREPFDTAEARTHYLNLFFPTLTRNHKAIAEGSVSTLYDQDALRRILRCFPHAKFVVMVRNPLEMLPSYHARVLFLLDEDQADFGRAWDLQDERVEGRSLPRDCRDPRLLIYGTIGRVGAAVQQLFETAGRERCHVVVYDDYARDPIAAQREILGFVDLDPDKAVQPKYNKVTRTYRSRPLQRLLRRPPKQVRQRLQPNPHRPRPKKRTLFGRIVQFLRDWNVVDAPRPVLEPDVRDRIIAELSEDVALLSRLIGRDLSPWFATRRAAKPAPAARKAARA